MSAGAEQLALPLGEAPAALVETVSPARARPRAERLPDPAAHPAAVYLARLGPGSRKAQALALERIARIASVGRAGAVELDWTALGYAECQAIRAELASRYAPATANRHLSALRGVRRECFRLGLISAEALARSADLAGVRGERLPAGRHVSSLELLALFQSCASDPRPVSGARDAALIAVLAGAALRRAEASALDLADVDLGEGSLVVRGKGGRERRAFLAQGGEEAVGAWIDLRGSEPGPLFVGVSKGGAIDPAMGRVGPDAILAILRRRARRAGVADFSAHDLRRTFIGEALEAGADLAAVQQLAGHRSVTTTARYDRRPEAARRSAARRVRIPYVARA